MEKLSIIIPVYNEESTITQVLEKLINMQMPVKTEIIVADDGSTDKTADKIKNFHGKELMKVHTSLINLGKGAAVRFGLEYAEGDYVIIQDADLELDPEDILKLIEPVLNKKADIVYGSRFKVKSKEHKKFPWITRFGNRVMTIYCNLLYGGRLTDLNTAYKLIKTDIIKSINLKCVGFEIDAELTAKLFRLGYKISEVPISYQPRTIEEGKKVTWKDGVIHMYNLTKYRFAKKENFKRKINAPK
jgi:dolichol-phosphate mannosyltransferase